MNLLRKGIFQKVYFENCGVNTAGQSILFDIIKFHLNLDTLHLDGNKLNDEDAINLSDALRYNKTLDELSLGGNEFTKSGEDALKKVVYDGSSLNAVADSNHVCTIEGLDSWEWPVREVYSNANYCSQRNRAQKIFDLLEERNREGTNVHHLETEMGEDTLKIVPLALAAVQIYGKQRVEKRVEKRVEHTGWSCDTFVTIKDAPELSITYELLRSWHVTALFDGSARAS